MLNRVAPNLFVLQLVALLFGLQPLSAQAGGAAEKGSVIRPGDVVRVTVWRNEELSGEFEIGADGVVRHPLYQNLQLSGTSLPAAEAQLRDFLRRFQAEPHFSIEVLAPVLITGEVASPGVYNVSPGATIERGLMLAGGPTREGRLDRVIVHRGGVDMLVDLRGENGGAATRLTLQSGDRVVVPRKRNVLRDVVLPVTTAVGSVTSLVTFFLFVSRGVVPI